MDKTLTRQQIEEVLQSAFNEHRATFADTGIVTWKQWVKEYAPEQIAAVLGSDKRYTKDMSDVVEVVASYKNPPLIKEAYKKAPPNEFSTIDGKGSNEQSTLVVPDIDRYISDDYAINFAFQETNKRLSIGIYVTNYKVGISGYQQYWHYKKTERTRAKQTFELIKWISQKVVEEIKESELPHALVKPFLRNRLDSVDPGHKEKSGVQNYNWYTTDVEKVDDWRATLYGGRYPDADLEEMQNNWSDHEKNVKIQVDVDGNSPRDKRYKLKRSAQNEGITKTASQDGYIYNNMTASELLSIAGSYLAPDLFPDPSQPVSIRVRESVVEHLSTEQGMVDQSVIEVQTGHGWIPINQMNMTTIAQSQDKFPGWLVLTLLGVGGYFGFQVGQNFPEQPQPEMQQVQQVQPAEQPQETWRVQFPDEADVDIGEIQERMHEEETQDTRPRGIRNNNPGNIERGNIQWQGMAADQTADDRFIVFDYPQDGIRAMARVLRNYQRQYNLRTLNDIIGRWAPAVENDVNSYAHHVAGEANISPDADINLEDDGTLQDVMTAMIRHENGEQPYDDNTIAEGIAAERGGRPWADANDMAKEMPEMGSRDPVVVNQPKRRSPEPPPQIIQPFNTQQTNLFRGAMFTYAYQNMDRVKAKQLLYRAVAEAGPNWQQIVHVLINKYDVPKDWLSYLNQEYLTGMASMASGRRWRQKLS